MADRYKKHPLDTGCSAECSDQDDAVRSVRAKDAENVNRVLYAISDAVNSTQDLEALYQTIHQVLGTVLDVTNFFIALVDQQKRTLYFPYHVDVLDEDFSPITDFDTGTSLTGLVVALKKPVLLHAADLHERASREGIWGPEPVIWMGVPLLIREEVIGIIAVQHYSDPMMYDEADLQLLTAISHQTAVAIDRKQSLELLKNSEETYRNMFLNAPVGLFRVNPGDGIFAECNEAMARMLGFAERRECVDQYSLYDGYIDQHGRQKMVENVQAGGGIHGLETLFRRRDGTSIWLRLSVRIDETSRMLEGVAEDISDFKAAQEEKLELQEQLIRSKKMEALGLLAGGVAHDLNNMLSGIINYPAMMLMKLDKEHELVRPITAIQESGKRIAMIVDDLLTMARSAASVREVRNLNTLVEEYLLSPECQVLKDRYPEVKIVMDLSAIQANISCSPVHIRKCLMNLFANAAEAVAGKGEIALCTANQQTRMNPVAQKSDESESGWVSLMVQDTGRGIDAKDIVHIFEPFYSKKTMGNTSGTGLGLTVVWNTVQDHQGTVRVASDKKGTTFTLTFPTSTKAILPSVLEIDEENLKGAGQSILVVDDEPQLRDIAGSFLADLGYATCQASSGEEALNLLKKQPFDLVILDMLMEPGWNGRQTYERMRKERPEQKAIIVSGFSESAEVRASLALGVGRFLKKPYSLEQLSLAVRHELAR